MTGLESPYDSAYNDAMERVEGQVLDQKEMAKQVLSWISCARRQLTTVELRNALAVELNEPEFDRDNVPDLIDIVSVCAGLVTVDEKSDIIRLVHYTTQEFFQRTWTSWFPDAHWMVARTCVTYLSFDTFKTGSCSTDKDFETRLYQYPLYSYAAANWGFHYQAQPVDVRLAIRFLSDINTLDACVQGLWAKKLSPNHFEYSQRFPKQFAMLHVAACFGLEGVMQQLIQLGHETNVKDSYGRTPLSWAAQDGCDAVVRILLENRADPNSKDKDGLSPLSWAAISGHETVAELLLEKGAHSDMKHEDGRTPLLWTAYRGHERLLQLLLENGADPDSKDKNGLSPLSLAAFSGRKSVVHLLLKNGVDSDSKDVNGRTSLSQAASSGHKEIVQLLLEWGVDLESRDKNGQTALLLAAQKGHEEVVHLLQNQEYDQFPKSKHK
jgi:ankyrin repeat protein